MQFALFVKGYQTIYLKKSFQFSAMSVNLDRHIYNTLFENGVMIPQEPLTNHKRRL